MTDETIPIKLGRYEIVRELGKGAMGVVYEGHDPNIGRRVAIKSVRTDIQTNPDTTTEMFVRFQREAQAAGRLNHPNIVIIYDVFDENDMVYIAMEYLEGRELKAIIEDNPKMAPNEAVEIAATLCEALAHAHRQGVIHRDIKPSNILLLENGNIKITDFGIARLSDSTLTRDGALIGTPYYMSPEQFTGEKVDGRSDLFAVGVILYELLSGEKPFTGSAISTVMHNVLKSDPIPLDELNVHTKPALAQVVGKMLKKHPDARYPDGITCARALREALKENPDSSILLAVSPEDETPTLINESAATLINSTNQSTAEIIPGHAEELTTPAGAISPKDTTAPRPLPQTKPHRIGVLQSIIGGAFLAVFIATGWFFFSMQKQNNAVENMNDHGSDTTSLTLSSSPFYSEIPVEYYYFESEDIVREHPIKLDPETVSPPRVIVRDLITDEIAFDNEGKEWVTQIVLSDSVKLEQFEITASVDPEIFGFQSQDVQTSHVAPVQPNDVYDTIRFNFQM